MLEISFPLRNATSRVLKHRQFLTVRYAQAHTNPSGGRLDGVPFVVAVVVQTDIFPKAFQETFTFIEIVLRFPTTLD